jgi:hypothetical protein
VKLSSMRDSNWHRLLDRVKRRPETHTTIRPAHAYRPGPRPRSKPLTGSTLPSNRGARIRTGDPLLPKQVRYRTAPRPEVIVLVLLS